MHVLLITFDDQNNGIIFKKYYFFSGTFEDAELYEEKRRHIPPATYNIRRLKEMPKPLLTPADDNQNTVALPTQSGIQNISPSQSPGQSPNAQNDSSITDQNVSSQSYTFDSNVSSNSSISSNSSDELDLSQSVSEHETSSEDIQIDSEVSNNSPEKSNSTPTMQPNETVTLNDNTNSNDILNLTQDVMDVDMVMDSIIHSTIEDIVGFCFELQNCTYFLISFNIF